MKTFSKRQCIQFNIQVLIINNNVSNTVDENNNNVDDINYYKIQMNIKSLQVRKKMFSLSLKVFHIMKVFIYSRDYCMCEPTSAQTND